MKTYLNYSQKNAHINNNLLMRKHKQSAQQKTREKNINSRENTELNRPARAISFGGSAGLNKVARLGKKAVTGTIEFVNENEAAYNAIYSLIVAGILKPFFVLNMPGSEDKDKQIVATKNFLQAFIGCFFNLTIGGGFVKKAIDVVKTNWNLFDVVQENGKDKIQVLEPLSQKALETAKDALEKQGKKPNIDEIVDKSDALIKNFNDNHLKAFSSNPDFVRQIKSGVGNSSTYKDAFEVFWKNSTGTICAILKAKASSLLLPGVMAFLFAKKNAQKEAMEKAKQNILLNNSSFKIEQQQFQKMMNKNNGSNLAFKGNVLSKALDGAIDGTATLIEKAGMYDKFGEPLTKVVSKFKKPSARMADFESFAITAYWLQNTARNKKIEPSQRLGLNVHSALVTVVSSTAAFIIDWLLDGRIDKSKENYKRQLAEIADSVKNMEHGENLDTVLQNIPEQIKLGIKDEVVRVLDSKKVLKVTNEDIAEIINNLKSTKTFEGFKLNEDLIRNAADSLEKSEPIRKEIAKICEDKVMVGAKDVAKKLSRAIGDKDAVDKTIKKLTADYGKKLSKFKSLTIFTLVVRFLVPVLMVPYSGKLKKKVAAWQEQRLAQKAQNK